MTREKFIEELNFNCKVDGKEVWLNIMPCLEKLLDEHEESFRKVVNMLRKNQLSKPFQSVKTLEKYERIVELFDDFKPVRLDKNCTKKEVAHKKREKRLDKFKARLDEFWENEYQKKLNYS